MNINDLEQLPATPQTLRRPKVSGGFVYFINTVTPARRGA